MVRSVLKLTNNWYKSSVVNSSTFKFVLNGLVNDSGFINALSLTAFDVDDENAEDNEEVEDEIIESLELVGLEKIHF